MGRNRRAVRALTLLLVFSVCAAMLPVSAGAADAREEESAGASPRLLGSRYESYGDYRAAHTQAPSASRELLLDAASYARSEGDVTDAGDGSVLTGSDSTVTWRFRVEEPGYYQLAVDYYPTVSKGGSIERTLLLDGEVPYEEARYIEFPRVYVDGEITRNSKGNDVTPRQIEQPERMTYVLHDADGFVAEDLALYLTAGEHTLDMRYVPPGLVPGACLSALAAAACLALGLWERKKKA